MSRWITTIIGLSIGLALLSCATQKSVEKRPPPKFKGVVLAKAIDSAGTIAKPKLAASEFDPEDQHVFSLATFENMTGTHQLRWEWIDPQGKMYIATRNYPLEVKQGKYLPKVTAWHQISLKDEAAADMPGEWSVKLFVDDEMIDSKPFLVKDFKDPLTLPEGATSRPYPKDWGLIIGIENYNRLPTVSFARKDALIVRDYFIRVLGVPEANIISLIDTDATKARIEGYLKKYIPANVGKDTTLYVYYAGHGMPGLTKGEPYLVPFDADTQLIEQTGYKLTTFYQDLHQIELKRVYVFLDSCFSGMASRAAEMLVKNVRPALIHVENVQPPSSSIISLNATTTDQLSNAWPEKRHGLFTYYLLRGIRGMPMPTTTAGAA